MRCLFLMLSFICCFAVAEEHDFYPDPNFDLFLSSSGPSVKDFSLQRSPAKRFSRSERSGSEMYTYLRCHYRVHDGFKRVESNYKWAVNEDGSYYSISGFWWSNDMLDSGSMFYSRANHDDLIKVCNRSLQTNGLNRTVEMISAADNQLSFNHTIWNIEPPVKKGKFDRIISFGDSMSDSQNIFNASMWKFPHRDSWYFGRFSNGKVWVEYLAEHFGLPLHNWAAGGAAADSFLLIPGVVQQVESWHRYIAQDTHYKPENTLFTVLVGANDLLNYQRSVDNILEYEHKAFINLISGGAKNILVLNLPDISRAPIFKLRNDGTRIKIQVDQYNQKLRELINQIQAEYGSSIKIRLFDLHALFNDLLTQPANYSFANVERSCLEMDSISLEVFFDSAPLRDECAEPDKYIFWDRLHPSTHAHQKLAYFTKDFVKRSF